MAMEENRSFARMSVESDISLACDLNMDSDWLYLPPGARPLQRASSGISRTTSSAAELASIQEAQRLPPQRPSTPTRPTSPLHGVARPTSPLAKVSRPSSPSAIPRPSSPRLSNQAAGNQARNLAHHAYYQVPQPIVLPTGNAGVKTPLLIDADEPLVQESPRRLSFPPETMSSFTASGPDGALISPTKPLISPAKKDAAPSKLPSRRQQLSNRFPPMVTASPAAEHGSSYEPLRAPQSPRAPRSPRFSHAPPTSHAGGSSSLRDFTKQQAAVSKSRPSSPSLTRQRTSMDVHGARTSKGSLSPSRSFQQGREGLGTTPATRTARSPGRSAPGQSMSKPQKESIGGMKPRAEPKQVAAVLLDPSLETRPPNLRTTPLEVSRAGVSIGSPSRHFLGSPNRYPSSSLQRSRPSSPTPSRPQSPSRTFDSSVSTKSTVAPGPAPSPGRIRSGSSASPATSTTSGASGDSSRVSSRYGGAATPTKNSPAHPSAFVSRARSSGAGSLGAPKAFHESSLLLSSRVAPHHRSTSMTGHDLKGTSRAEGFGGGMKALLTSEVDDTAGNFSRPSAQDRLLDLAATSSSAASTPHERKEHRALPASPVHSEGASLRSDSSAHKGTASGHEGTERVDASGKKSASRAPGGRGKVDSCRPEAQKRSTAKLPVQSRVFKGRDAALYYDMPPSAWAGGGGCPSPSSDGTSSFWGPGYSDGETEGLASEAGGLGDAESDCTGDQESLTGLTPQASQGSQQPKGGKAGAAVAGEASGETAEGSRNTSGTGSNPGEGPLEVGREDATVEEQKNIDARKEPVRPSVQGATRAGTESTKDDSNAGQSTTAPGTGAPGSSSAGTSGRSGRLSLGILSKTADAVASTTDVKTTESNNTRSTPGPGNHQSSATAVPTPPPRLLHPHLRSNVPLPPNKAEQLVGSTRDLSGRDKDRISPQESELYGDLVNQVKAQIDGWKKEDSSLEVQLKREVQQQSGNQQAQRQKECSDADTGNKKELAESSPSQVSEREPQEGSCPGGGAMPDPDSKSHQFQTSPAAAPAMAQATSCDKAETGTAAVAPASNSPTPETEPKSQPAADSTPSPEAPALGRSESAGKPAAHSPGPQRSVSPSSAAQGARSSEPSPLAKSTSGSSQLEAEPSSSGGGSSSLWRMGSGGASLASGERASSASSSPSRGQQGGSGLTKGLLFARSPQRQQQALLLQQQQQLQLRARSTTPGRAPRTGIPMGPSSMRMGSPESGLRRSGSPGAVNAFIKSAGAAAGQLPSLAGNVISGFGANVTGPVYVTSDGQHLIPRSFMPDYLDWERSSSLADETYSDISTPSTRMSRNMTLEEATDTVVFCSSIVHDLVYRAATLAELTAAAEAVVSGKGTSAMLLGDSLEKGESLPTVHERGRAESQPDSKGKEGRDGPAQGKIGRSQTDENGPDGLNPLEEDELDAGVKEARKRGSLGNVKKFFKNMLGPRRPPSPQRQGWFVSKPH